MGGLLPSILSNSLLGYTIQPNNGFSTTAFYVKSVLLILVLTSCLSTVGKSASQPHRKNQLRMREVIRCSWCYYYSIADSTFYSLENMKLLLLDSAVKLFSFSVVFFFFFSFLFFLVLYLLIYSPLSHFSYSSS